MQKRKKAFLWSSILLTLLVILIFFMQINKPHQSAAGLHAAMRITAAKLFDDYITNESFANNQYLNKIIEVEGTVLENSTAHENIILLETGHTGAVNCAMMDEKKVLMQIKKNEPLIVKGKCTGFLADVNLTDCVIVKQ